MCIGLKPGIKGTQPSLAIYEFDRQWKLLQYQLHHIKGLDYAHDFLLLEDYYVFHMTPFSVYSWKAALLVFSGFSSPGELLAYHSDLPSRFVVIPRHERAKYQEIRFFDTEPFHVREGGREGGEGGREGGRECGWVGGCRREITERLVSFETLRISFLLADISFWQC